VSTPAKMQIKWIKNSQFQSLLLLGLLLFFVGHFVLLSPSSLEEDFNGVRIIQPKDLLNFLKNEPAVLAKDVPENEAPSYSVRNLVFFSSVENQPNWKLLARKSNVYQKEQIMHGRDVTIILNDGTTIQSKEAVMYIIKNEIRFYGDVVANLKNGTILRSQFLKVLTRPVTQLEIPLSEVVTGEKSDPKKPKNGRMDFQANGLFYADIEPQELKLLSQVTVNIHDDELTVIHSDEAVYNSLKNHLSFRMNESDKLEKQFATVHQPDLDIKSRSLEVDTTSHQELQTITALNDVFIRDEHDPERLVTATSGKAIYNNVLNEIHLSDFPQVYQDNDTITGDIIVFNRNRDTIEVRQSNAIYKRQYDKKQSNGY
jgi:lipopolysaccharide transport protein LptA